MNSRPQRNLLLLIDGRKSDEQLLASVVGTSAADFMALRDLGLVASSSDAMFAAPMTAFGAAPVQAQAQPQPPVPAAVRVPPAATAAAPAPSTASRPAPAPAPAKPNGRASHEPFIAAVAPAAPKPVVVHVDIPVDVRPIGPSADHLSKTLTAIIASELGLRGFTLTLAVERAAGVDALLEVAAKVLSQVESRKGAVNAEKARRALFGR